MMILTSDAAEPVELPDADQPYDWPIWLDHVATIAASNGVHDITNVHVEELLLAWESGTTPQDAYQRVIAADFVEF